MDMDLNSLQNSLEKDLQKGLIPTSILLGKFRLLSEEYRSTPAYMDSTNFPFYYYLGRYLNPKKILEIGFDFGYRTGCFLQSCGSVTDFQAVEGYVGGYYNARLGIKNIKSVYTGDFNLSLHKTEMISLILPELGNEYDLAIINEEMNFDQYRSVFDVVFDMLKVEGLMVVGFVSDKCKEAFVATSKIHNREYLLISTRYGTGIIKK